MDASPFHVLPTTMHQNCRPDIWRAGRSTAAAMVIWKLLHDGRHALRLEQGAGRLVA